MPLDRRSLRIIFFRGLTLTFTLFVVIILTAVIIGATGYDEMILRAQIDEEVRAYTESLRKAASSYTTEEEIKRLADEYRDRLVKIYGLDKPWYIRSFTSIPKLITLDLYVSHRNTADVLGLTRPLTVGKAIAVALPRTILMITIAYIISAFIAIPLGPFIAYKRGSILDKSIIGYAALTNAFPVWWVAMLAIYISGFYLGIAPTSYRPVIARISDFSDSIRNLDIIGAFSSLQSILYYSYIPIIVVTITILGGWLYSTRAVAIRVVSEDYVIAARAKGLPESTITRKYIMRVIAGPVLTFVILGLAGSIGGYIITESIFDWPGMGLLYYEAISSGDSTTILALVYVTTLIYVIARFILEILYVILDPRVKL